MKTPMFEDYPANYEHIPFGERMQILAKFKCNEFKDWKELNEYQEALQERGIYMEYGWVGHREEWFMATSYDAMMQEEYVYSLY